MPAVNSINYDPDLGVCFRVLSFLGFPAYRVGDDGSVWSKWGHGPGPMRKDWHRLKPRQINPSGHQTITLHQGDDTKIYLIHHLVLLAFVGPRPPGMECRHFPDRDPTNNRIENLRWGTRSENQEDRNVQGTGQKGEKGPRAKLKDSDILSMRKRYRKGVITYQELADEKGVSVSLVCLIIKRKVWDHI